MLFFLIFYSPGYAGERKTGPLTYNAHFKALYCLYKVNRVIYTDHYIKMAITLIYKYKGQSLMRELCLSPIRHSQ